MEIKHKHHIIPKHAGGSDDPSNIVELTIEEHAEAHRKLYEQHGRWQDKIAWQALAGMIGKEEIIQEMHKNRDRSYMKTEQFSNTMSKATKSAWAEGKKKGHSNHITEKFKAELSERNRKRKQEMINNDWHRNGPGK